MKREKGGGHVLPVNNERIFVKKASMARHSNQENNADNNYQFCYGGGVHALAGLIRSLRLYPVLRIRVTSYAVAFCTYGNYKYNKPTPFLL